MMIMMKITQSCEWMMNDAIGRAKKVSLWCKSRPTRFDVFARSKRHRDTFRVYPANREINTQWYTNIPKDAVAKVL